MNKETQTIFKEDGSTEDYTKLKEIQYNDLKYTVWEKEEYND